MLKERAFLVCSIAAAILAGYGAMALWWRWIGGASPGDALPAGLVVGIATLALMVRGLVAVRAERLARTFKS